MSGTQGAYAYTLMRTLLAFLTLLSVTVTRVVAAAPAQDAAAGPQSAANVLALQVAEIASSTKLTPKTKEARIATMVRKAVILATVNVNDPAQAVSIAVDLATAAAGAAPEFTDAIINSVSSVPSIASIDGAVAALNTSVKAAASPDTQNSNENRPGSPYAPTSPPPGPGSGVVASPSQKPAAAAQVATPKS